MHESEKWKWSHSVLSDPQWPHGLQPTRLLCPWGSPGNSTGVGCHCLFRQCGLLAPKYNVSNSTFRPEGHKDLYNGLSTLWKRILMKHNKSLEGLHSWRCHHCYRKTCEIHQTSNNKLLLEKAVSRCFTWLHRLYNRANQGNHVDIEEKIKKKVECKGFQYMDLRETQELIDITSKEQTENNLREMSASEPMLKKMKKQC